MRKKTSITMALALAAILTTSAFALALPNQAYALHFGPGPHVLSGPPGAQVGKVLSGEEAQVGKILSEHQTQLGKVGLGDVCLSCWGG
jgi:hypothetical protein